MLVATIAAACAGVFVGLLRGGRLVYLAHVPIRFAWLASLAWLIQVGLFVSPLAEGLDAWAAPIHLGSIALITAVILANRALPGVALLGFGLALNASVYAANGGFMPVAESALVVSGNNAALSAMASGVRYQKTVLAQPDTPLWFLGDILPLALVSKVYSPGDVAAAVGLFLLVTDGMRDRGR